MPGGGTRSDRAGQGIGDFGPAFGRTDRPRYRFGMERRGDGEPRRRVEESPQGDAREGRRDEGDLDPGKTRVPRRIRQFRSHLVQSQAVAEAPCSNPDGRQWIHRDQIRRPPLRRMDAQRGAGRSTERVGARAAPRTGTSRPRSQELPDNRFVRTQRSRAVGRIRKNGYRLRGVRDAVGGSRQGAVAAGSAGKNRRLLNSM